MCKHTEKENPYFIIGISLFFVRRLRICTTATTLFAGCTDRKESGAIPVAMGGNSFSKPPRNLQTPCVLCRSSGMSSVDVCLQTLS